MISDRRVFELRCEFLAEVFKDEPRDKLEAWARCPHPVINWSCMPWKDFLERKVNERVIHLSDIDDLYASKRNERYLLTDEQEQS